MLPVGGKQVPGHVAHNPNGTVLMWFLLFRLLSLRLQQGGAKRDAALPSWMPGADLPGYLNGTLPGVSWVGTSQFCPATGGNTEPLASCACFHVYIGHPREQHQMVRDTDVLHHCLTQDFGFDPLYLGQDPVKLKW